MYNDPLFESGTFSLERFIPETNTKFVYGGDDNATWDNYGAVISGYIIAPETGEYRFFFHSDDNGELYLSTDTTEDNLELICSVTGTANIYVLDDENERSALVNLEAGKRYLFQAIWKEGGGGGAHCDHIDSVKKRGAAAEVEVVAVAHTHLFDPETRHGHNTIVRVSTAVEPHKKLDDTHNAYGRGFCPRTKAL